MIRRILAAAALTAALPLAASAASGDFLQQRSELRGTIERTLGPNDTARVTPIVESAQQRMLTAIRGVARAYPTPAQILDPDQRAALIQAGATGDTPAIDLRPDQRSKLEAYSAAVRNAIWPVIRADGARIDALLTPRERTRIDALRQRLSDQLQAQPGGLPGQGIARGFAQMALHSSGTFVLAVETDPSALITAIQ